MTDVRTRVGPSSPVPRVRNHRRMCPQSPRASAHASLSPAGALRPAPASAAARQRADLGLVAGYLRSLRTGARAEGRPCARSGPTPTTDAVLSTGPADRHRAVEEHWAASEAGDVERGLELYHDDAVIEYPQSGERITGLSNIRALRTSHPAKLGFRVRSVSGYRSLWVSETAVTCDGKPVHMVSHMQFRGAKVSHETQYFADPFEAPEWRSAWVERTRVIDLSA
jgi:ketosteroid isomerase-like protein